MSRQAYRYQLIRYVADLERMEPVNIGVVVQSEQGIDFKINGHFQPDRRLKPDFDRDNFRSWRDFFAAELRSRKGRRFAPPPSSEEFLRYLMSRANGNYQLTEPLLLEASETSLGELRDQLFARLVRRGAVDGSDRATAPVGRFREEVEEKRLERRFAGVLHHHEYVDLGGLEQFYYYWYQNGRALLIDKVEAVPQIRQTQLEAESLLTKLRSRNQAQRPHQVVAILDPASKLPKPECEGDERFLLHYGVQTAEIRSLADRVIDTADGSSSFVAELERELIQTTRS